MSNDFYAPTTLLRVIVVHKQWIKFLASEGINDNKVWRIKTTC